MNKTISSDQLVRGMLYFAVLSVLECKENYGARILLQLEGTPFETKAGTLYPLMTRMEKSQLISSRWVIEDGKPPMKFYAMTKTGEDTLADLRTVLGNMNKVLGGNHEKK